MTVEDSHCKACGVALPEAARFCGVCGTPRPSVRPPSPPSTPPRTATVLESPPSLGAAPPYLPGPRPQFTRPRNDVRPPVDVLTPPVPMPTTNPASAEDRLPMRSFAPRPALVGAALLFVVLLVAGVLVVRAFQDDLTLRVVHDGNLPVLVVHAPSLDDGTELRVLERTVTVRAGEGRLALAADVLRVGPNDIPVAHDGTSELLRVEVDHLVSRDDEALLAVPPRIGILVRALPGRTLRVDGRAVPLDARGEARVGVEASADGRAAEHVFRVELGGGEANVVESIRATAPAAALDVRQPPATFVTDRASLELDARVAPAAHATLDGTPLANEAGRLRATLSLPREGSFLFRLDVVEPGAIRRTQVFSIRRSADLATAATTFAVDRSVTYDALVGRADALRGSRVEFAGRIVHLRVEGGRSTVQFAAEPCASSVGCAIWAEYPAVTTLRVGDLVRVRGTADGMQTYRDAAGGNERSAPRVLAAFLSGDVP